MPTPEPRVLVFDIGNVVVEVDFMRVLRHWADSSGRRVEDLRERFTADEHYERHERGEIDASTYFASLRESLCLDLDDAELTAGWNAVFAGEVPGIRDVLDRARRHLPIYAFSNTNEVHLAEFSVRYARVLEPFERVFVSCTLGRRKPEREAFELVTRAIGVPAGDVLFFDDSVENVEGARAVGLRAVQVSSAQAVSAALEEHLGIGW